MTATLVDALQRDVYLTDGVVLVYVLRVSPEGAALVENAVTLERDWLSFARLEDWRLVEPEHG